MHCWHQLVSSFVLWEFHTILEFSCNVMRFSCTIRPCIFWAYCTDQSTSSSINFSSRTQSSFQSILSSVSSSYTKTCPWPIWISDDSSPWDISLHNPILRLVGPQAGVFKSWECHTACKMIPDFSIGILANKRKTLSNKASWHRQSWSVIGEL